jgi:uncharacterized coiled-coil protein SlyX
MPTVTETQVTALASCKDGRCAGYKQQPVQAVETLTEYTYLDLGGDIPGVERSATALRFADLADAQCEHCGEPRLVSEQTRPIYPNVSGQPQDALLSIHKDSERVRDLELSDARRDATMAQMQALMAQQAAVIERQSTQIESLIAQQAAPRTRSRAARDDAQE